MQNKWAFIKYHLQGKFIFRQLVMTNREFCQIQSIDNVFAQ